jgi:hypothetical protein
MNQLDFDKQVLQSELPVMVDEDPGHGTDHR